MVFRGGGAGESGGGDEGESEEMTPEEIVEAFCDLEPADAWAAFRAVAADPAQTEDRRIRAAAWLAIANALSSLQGDQQ